MIFAVSVKFAGIPLPIAILMTIMLGGLLGALNGVLSAYLRIPAFITTLAAFSAFRGMAFLFNNGSPVFSVHDALEGIFYGTFPGLPLPLYYLIVLHAGAWCVLRYTSKPSPGFPLLVLTRCRSASLAMSKNAMPSSSRTSVGVS